MAIDAADAEPRAETPHVPAPRHERRRLAPWTGLVVAVGLVVTAMVLPRLADWQVYARQYPEKDGTFEPLHGFWAPHWWGPGTGPAIVLAVLGVAFGPRLAERLPWRGLLAGAFVVSLGWMLALALTDGRDGVSHVLENPYEYLETARTTDDVPQMLDEWVARMPKPVEDNWPTHVAGHPPLATLFFIALVRLGFDTGWSAGLVVVVVAATTAPAVLVALRALGVEGHARLAAPFLVLTPAAIFMAVSADAVFAAVAAWGLATLALAATASSRRGVVGWSVVAGLLLGCCVLLSYGLPLLGLLALAVLVAARGSWVPLPVAAATALVPVLVMAAYGFVWWEAYPVLVDRYWDGVAPDRPGEYWTWANLAALLICTGPVLGAGLGRAAGDVVHRETRREHRVVLLLVAATAVTIAIATSSQMSRAEVERIWLPFVPWLTISLALLPRRWRTAALASQVVVALVVETLLYTSW